MSRGHCRLNGGCNDGQEPELRSSSGLITLEDLEAFNEDLDSDPATSRGYSPQGENEEAMEEDEDQARLLHFWQDVARGHQVDVPGDMAIPIQQLTTDIETNQNREKVPFTPLSHKEKCGVLLYEKRHLEKANWACTTVREDTYEQSICLGFMKLMRYISQQNSSGNYLGMTIPIVTVVHTDEPRSTMSRDVTVAYYLPQQHQDQPPQPLDPDVAIETWPSTIIYSRPFSGITNETSILREIGALTEVLDSLGLCPGSSFIVAGYTSLAATQRRNEIWFIERC